jgi:UDP-2-acetamido-3-amino-2,3-dideoxy-glucuronate N-acetyltransferase
MLGILRSLWYLFRHFSIVHFSFSHGSNFKLGYFNRFEKNTSVGNNISIQNYVLLKEGTVIGNNCYIDSYVRSSGDNIIGNNITIRFGSTIARKVYIDDDVFISPNVMTVYSLPDKSVSSATYIRRGAFIGTAAVIAPNITIGEGVIIGTNSFVNKNYLERGVYAGNPAKKI